MNIYCISDLHLTSGVDKPMDKFGITWVGHWDKIRTDWRAKVTENDVVLLAGDLSWGMNIPQAIVDLQEIAEMPGKKIIIRGNHDFWWSSYNKLKNLNLPGVCFLQNNAIAVGDYVFCGTRGWTVPEKNSVQNAEDKKIFDREVIRLELSLKNAVAIAEGREIVGMIHFPPFNSSFDKSEFCELFSKYGVKKVVYGHLHGNKFRRVDDFIKINDVKYFLTSCDLLNNKLIQI